MSAENGRTMNTNTWRDKASVSICAMVPYPPDTTPSQRFRIEQWAPYLATQGIQVDLKPFVSPRMMQNLHQPGGLAGKATQMIEAFGRRALEVSSLGKYD